MPILLMAVIDDPTRVWEVLDAWRAAGVPGMTVMDSMGMHHVKQLRDDLPLFPSVRNLMEQPDATHRTLWSVVPDNFDVEAVVRATESIVGPLSDPDTGILIALPVLKAWGLRPPER